jgi:hypothetical protein
MRLVVLGPAGVPFAASYKVDGVELNESGVMPATIDFSGRNAKWEVVREQGNEDFRVEFYVGELVRQSTTTAGKSGIRGGIVYERDRERSWSEAFEQ